MLQYISMLHDFTTPQHFHALILLQGYSKSYLAESEHQGKNIYLIHLTLPPSFSPTRNCDKFNCQHSYA